MAVLGVTALDRVVVVRIVGGSSGAAGAPGVEGVASAAPLGGALDRGNEVPIAAPPTIVSNSATNHVASFSFDPSAWCLPIAPFNSPPCGPQDPAAATEGSGTDDSSLPRHPTALACQAARACSISARWPQAVFSS